MSQESAIRLALKALTEYDQFGLITNHRYIMRELLLALPDESHSQELLEISSILMTKTIEQAKRGNRG
jgi:predicted transposase YdaD